MMNVPVPALIPPFRFSTVQEGLYRGSYPTLKNLRFLARLRLKTVVSVVPEPPTTDLAAFCAGEKILHYHFFAEKFTSDSVTVSPVTVCQIVQLLLKRENLPLYLHCLDGANVTGVIVMVLRKLQNWTKVATISEFCRFTRDHGIEKDESDYLASFSEEIVVTADAPRWLWNGVRVSKHPTMIVHQPDLELSAAALADGPAAGGASGAAKWDSDGDKAEAILRQFEDSSRARALLGVDAPDGADDGEASMLDDAALESLPQLSRALEALDLAGI